jgi:hypothetical protein
MFRQRAKLHSRPTETSDSSLTTVPYGPAFLASFYLVLMFSVGCNTLSLPAIDPSGNRIFSGGPLQFVNPHDPNNGYPTQQPAYQTPPNPPACVQEGNKKLCKGCLAGKGCLAKRKEAEEVRGRCGQLLLTPTRIVAPVGGEVVLLAGVCGKDEYLVTNEPIEWMLSPKSVGEFVEVGDDAKGQRRSIWKKDDSPKVEKLGVDFARGRTSRETGRITRGTASPDDDLPIRKGQTWISLTSTSEGISKVTALAPDSDVWDQRRQTATIYWLDAEFQFPNSEPLMKSGEIVSLVTIVKRADGVIPAEGWKVRYTVLNPEVASFVFPGTDATSVKEVGVDREGRAAVRIQNDRRYPNGTAMIDIEIIKPADNTFPELPLGRETRTVTWNAAELQLVIGGPEIATPLQPLTYFATVASTGSLVAENVVLGVTIPPGMSLLSTSIPPTKKTDSGLIWEFSQLPGGRAIDVSLTLEAKGVFDGQIAFIATGSPELNVQKSIAISIQQPTLSLQITPQQNINEIEVGNQANFDIVVKNNGSQTVNDVEITLQSDPGLQHAQDNLNTLTQVIGFLTPGQTAKVNALFVVTVDKDLSITATAKSKGLGQVYATQTTTVRGRPATPKRPSVTLQLTSDLQQPAIRVGGTFELTWTISNTGPVTLKNPVLTIQHSPNLEVASLSQGYDYRVESQVGKWLNLPDIPPGNSIRLSGAFIGNAAGQATIDAVVDVDGIRDKKSATIDVGNTSPNRDGMPPNNPVGVLNKPPLVLNEPAEKRLSVSIRPISNSIRKGELATYEITIENLSNKADQRIALSLLTPEGTALKAIRAKDLQFKTSKNDRQIDLEPIKYFRPNDSFSCVVEMRHDIVGQSELMASVTSLGQTNPVTNSVAIQVLR